MKKILIKISRVLQVVLLAPVKLPGKALNILKYIALGLGVVETVLDKEEGPDDSASPIVPYGEKGYDQLKDAQANQTPTKQDLGNNKDREASDENE
ncbi:hypothetical protein ACFX5U_16035 [Sphingobacterium sp. SG20118]|uniref:hypothetical protein n=1 Tax=Sphingobacterium sp. SG20118 TaxID=3367156 RepID=UPI0037DFC6AC